jgi:hypothetical protein
VTALDPDELALLEEERDHLLSSLDDLEREHAAGDMDEVDYAALKDDYTVRAADVLRAIDAQRAVVHEVRPSRSRGRTVAVVVGVLAFAVLAGVLVARGSGQRGDNAITGSTGTLRERLATCRTTSFQKPAEGIDCYDKLLLEAPENLEALTYQGWAYVRSDQVEQGSANFDEVVQLDPTYPDVRVFRASVASDEGDFALASSELSQFYANDPSPAGVQVLQSQGLERKVFFGLLDADTSECWQAAAVGQGEEGTIDQQFLDTLGTCLDGVLAAAPDNVDALVSRALSELGPDDADLPAALALVERAVAADPGNANAVLLQASLAASDGRFDDSRALLTRLDGVERPTISFLIGGPESLDGQLDAAVASTTTTTTPGVVPNPNGG